MANSTLKQLDFHNRLSALTNNLLLSGNSVVIWPMKWACLPKPAFLLGTRMTLLPIIDLCASGWKGHVLWIFVAHGMLSIAFFSSGLMTASFRELTLKKLKLLLFLFFFFFLHRIF